MTTSAELELASVAVVPGGEATTTLTVRNDSEIVEAYEFEVVGEPAPWTTAEPARLSLYPGTSGLVTLTLRPPRSPEVPAGEIPLAVRVVPAEQPQLTVVPETRVSIQPYGEINAELVPTRRRAWRTGNFRVLQRNHGNTPVTVDLEGTDAEHELRTHFTPARNTLAPGAEAESRLKVRTSKLSWFGKPASKPFRVLAAPTAEYLSDEESAQPRELEGELVHLTVLPRWLLALLALLLALLLAWFALVRPSVQSAAREAAEGQAQRMVDNGQLAPGPSNPASSGSGGTQNPPGDQPGDQQQGEPGEQQPGSAGPGQQTSSAIQVRTNSGARNVGTYTVPEGRTFLITDLVLANFQGDEGMLTISFGGRTITTIALETFRNQDYHWVTPVEVGENQTVRAEVTCDNPGTPASGQQAATCLELLNVSGELRDWR